MKVVAYVPIKTNNQRLPGKNTKTFDDGTPLCSLLFNSLNNCSNIDEKYCFCSDVSIKEYLPQGITFLQRDSSLDSSSTLCNDIISSFISNVDADVYVLTHVTSPFLKTKTIEKCVDKVTAEGYDSAFTVSRIYDFLWDSNRQPVNFDPTCTVRSQDLEPLFKETNGVFVFTKDVFKRTNRRVGLNPYMCEVNELEAIDINIPTDFDLANSVYMGGNAVERY